jgi:8-oxo-dGTP diphosphatase
MMSSAEHVIRHVTASAIVFDDHGRVLLIFHTGAQAWLPPGGHVEDNEDFLQAAIREVFEETGIIAEPIAASPLSHPAVTTHPLPFLILEVDVSDPDHGPHRHIDTLDVLRAVGGHLNADLDEVGGASWVHLDEVGGLRTQPEIPGFLAAAARWHAEQQPLPPQPSDP